MSAPPFPQFLFHQRRVSNRISSPHPLSLVPTSTHLQDNYGKKDAEAEAAIKQMYIELKIEDVYKAYEEKSYAEILALTAEVDESVGIKREVFITFMNKIYKRTK